MNKEQAKEALEILRQYLRSEMGKAVSEDDEARMDGVQNGRTALSVLERVVGA